MSQLKPSRVSKWLWEGSILVIVILAGVLFWQYQSADKANRALYQQNQQVERAIAEEKAKLASLRNQVTADLRAGIPLASVHRPSNWSVDSASHREIISALIQQLKDDDRQQVKAHALVALQRHAFNGGGKAPFEPTIVELVTPCLYNPRLKYFARSVLRQLGTAAKPAASDILATCSGEAWYTVRQAVMEARHADPNCDVNPLLARYIAKDRYGKETFKNLVENFQPFEVVEAYRSAKEIAETREKQEHVYQVLDYLTSQASRAGSWSEVDLQHYLRVKEEAKGTK